MSNPGFGRRRFMAGVALLALTVRPSSGFAQDKPDCVRSVTVGAWEVTGYDDFWTVKQETSDGVEITVFDTFVSIGASDLKSEDGQYTLDEVDVDQFSISVDGSTVVTASADGFTNFSGADYDAIVAAFRAGRSAEVTIETLLFDGSGTFTLDGFIRATATAERLRDEMAAEAAANRCEPLDCFFTGAACGAVGLPDDCWELTTLRRFRDGTLARMPGGPEDIAAYYRTAPAIVAALAAGPHARRRLLALHWTCVVPCAVLASAGAARACRWLYGRHFNRLRRLAGV